MPRGIFDELIVRGRSVFKMFSVTETATAGVPDGTLRLWDDGAQQYIQTYSLAVGAWETFMSVGAFGGHFNGTFLESMKATTAESGGVVTLSLEQDGGGDLTMRFSDGLTLLDTTPAATIALTLGSDTSPQVNYIYVLQSTKVLTKSTSGWPDDAEHIKVAFLFVPSSAFVSSNGVYVNHNWNDHATDLNNMGHLSHVAERERATSAQWFSGIDGDGSSGYLTLNGTTVDLAFTAGLVYQMHPHVVPAFDTGDSGLVLVPNWNGDLYHDITNLYDIVADSGGNTIGNNKYFNLTVWGVANEGGELHQVMINLPSGFYNTLAGAQEDADGHDNFTMPREFDLDSTNGFLIARLTVRKLSASWTLHQTIDLRGTTPQTATGGGIVTEFSDAAFRVHGSADATKQMALEVDGVSAATTRTLTVQDANGTIALTADLPADPHAEAHTAASHSDQGATGAELETLTDGSNADALHVHSSMKKTSSGGYFLIPSGPAAGVTVASSTSANTYGSWVELEDSTSAAIFIVGYIMRDSSFGADYAQLDLGTGAEAAESSIGESYQPAGTAADLFRSEYFPFPIPVATSTRIAARTADNTTTAEGITVSLICINQADLVDL